MRVASYFVLSLALHAGVLAYPVSFSGQKQQQIRVTMLPIKEESLRADALAGNGNPAPRAAPKRKAPITPSPSPGSVRKPARGPEPQFISAEAPAKFSDGSVASDSAITNSAEMHEARIPAAATGGSDGSGAGTDSENAGKGSGRSGTGPGSDGGEGLSASGILLTQARYRDTPRPRYPESARREGRQGRVLLRVLVDDQGRSKQVEINSSSGSDALDRAAAEAIRHWQFHPARKGERPVESWLRIPIEFRLADAKS